MTIAVSLKVHDGLVLASDSASTLSARMPDGTAQVVNVYDFANKIANLYKGLPLGVITWGAGSIGPASIATIFKDFRAQLTGTVDSDEGQLDRSTYTVSGVATRLRSYVYEHLYVPAFSAWTEPPALGMRIGGYSAGGVLPEEYSIEMDGSGCPDPQLLRSESECGATWSGQPQALSRLLLGFDPQISEVFTNHLGVPPEQVPPALETLRHALGVPLVQDAMPIQDAIDLAEFMVRTTIEYVRFLPGPPTVGGAVEVAAITKHEGFKWIKRKHYYSPVLNPTEVS